MKYLIILLLTSTIIEMGNAQYQIGLIPRSSPDKGVYQKIGNTEVDIKYGSPDVKNRQVWNGLVPYDEVWRAGANNATTIHISTDIKINQMTLDSGQYTFFIIPRKNQKWTAIFNKVPQQWGAFKYNHERDALRIDIKPRRTSKLTESLSYAISHLGHQYGSIILSWEYVELEIPFETNYLDQFKLEVESRIFKQPDYLKWVVYLQGAEHLEQIKSMPEVALEWIDKAELIMNSTTEWNNQFYPKDYVIGHVYWIKAKLLARNGNNTDALSVIEKLKALPDSPFYKRNRIEIDRVLEDWNVE